MDGISFIWGYIFGHQQARSTAEQQGGNGSGGGGPVVLLVLELVFIGLAAYILISGEAGVLHWHPLAGIAGGFVAGLLWALLFTIPILGPVANVLVSYLYFLWVASFSDWVWGLVAFGVSVALHLALWLMAERSRAIRRLDMVALVIAGALVLGLQQMRSGVAKVQKAAQSPAATLQGHAPMSKAEVQEMQRWTSHRQMCEKSVANLEWKDPATQAIVDKCMISGGFKP